MTKVLYVSCQVKETNLWELLNLLKASKAANVEVHPVGDTLIANGHDTPPRKIKKGVRRKLAKEWKLKDKKRAGELAYELHANPKSIYSAITAMVEAGKVKRVAPGLFQRVKE